ncbi:MAG: putative manganese transporter [Pseudomonadota bacterium]|nr:putative manganese transporter [Pseudomonadota bacterium]MEC8127331.1 putative manganese transporter [Pseudomonadota bacterium]MEC8672631.1 putative manganese transporter [Pseudomonadota bacterium]
MDQDIAPETAREQIAQADPTSGGRAGLALVAILGPTILAALVMLTAESELLDIIFASIADAYLQVSTFVAATFLIIYGLERALNIDATAMLRRDTIWQVPVAAGLGALPGCGGAIIVVTQYVTGRLSFGGVVAALTATMGDAAFLLIAQEPLTGLAMVVLGFGVGTLSGWIINAIHGGDFLRGSATRPDAEVDAEHDDASTPLLDRIWLIILAPGMVLAALVAFQVDVDVMFATEMLEQPATLLGVVGGVLAVCMRLAPRFGIRGDAAFSAGGGLVRRTISDTNFVTVWVIFAYLVFELSVYFLGLDLKALFDGWALITPMIAILLGFLPGCGPQVLVTTMYLSGIIPLSAQIGNALSNDGDALFPAIAIAPKVAIVATLYSAVPAIILAYGWMFWME